MALWMCLMYFSESGVAFAVVGHFGSFLRCVCGNVLGKKAEPQIAPDESIDVSVRVVDKNHLECVDSSIL